MTRGGGGWRQHLLDRLRVWRALAWDTGDAELLSRAMPALIPPSRAAAPPSVSRCTRGPPAATLGITAVVSAGATRHLIFDAG